MMESRSGKYPLFRSILGASPQVIGPNLKSLVPKSIPNVYCSLYSLNANSSQQPVSAHLFGQLLPRWPRRGTANPSRHQRECREPLCGFCLSAFRVLCGRYLEGPCDSPVRMTDRAHGRPCNKNRRMTEQTGEVSETTGGAITVRVTKEKPFTPTSTPVTRIGGRQ